MNEAAVRDISTPRVRPPARPMATQMPRPQELLARRLAGAIFWLITILYAVVFSAISLRQYHAYIPHALDLGNMTQTFWNTVHGHLFKFQNMRAHVAVEAFGTSTRLSFHVEPIIPFLALLYLPYQHVETLLVLQSVALATGAIPVRMLARRHLHSALAEVAFPAAYLLYPALQAANLYEFHPVTFAAPLLLWAFAFADREQYTLFLLAGLAAIGCKEELGLDVALIGLWLAVRHRQWQFGAIVAVICVTWSFIALKMVIPHFNAADSSYWGRYVPTGYFGNRVVTQSDAIHFWLDHPSFVVDNLTSEAKLSYLHRILFPAGYLSLLNPLTLLVSLPSLALIMLSYEPHMISGVAHYSAELVPMMIVASVLGTEWLARAVAPRLRLSSAAAVALCSLYILGAGLSNQRANGFSPLASGFNYPTITAHDQLLDRVLSLIPSGASVSAQDNLNAHLSDREQIYLYPDTDGNRVQYIVLDATQPVGSVIRPCDLAVQVIGNNAACDVAAGPAASGPVPNASGVNRNALLRNGKWTILWAEDGILLLKRHHKGEPLQTTLPAAFFSFMNPPTSDVPPGKPVARMGDYLELEGFQISRAEMVNLRTPDVLITTWWKVLKPLPPRARLMHYLSDYQGALQVFSDDQQGTDWSTLSQWQPGSLHKVLSYQLSVTTNKSGFIDIDIGLSNNDRQYQVISNNELVTILNSRPGVVVVGGTAGPRVLKIAAIAATL
jgi:uncharacterized membrane protein